MRHGTRARGRAYARAGWSLALSSLVILACSQSVSDSLEEQTQQLVRDVREGRLSGGETLPIETLPFEDPLALADVFIQRLPEATPAGENVALHARLAPPSDTRLRDSLVRVLGEPEAPVVLFRTDALVELGVIEGSPGREFFTAFVKLHEEEVPRRLRAEQHLAKVNEPTRERVVFRGRTPVAVSTGISFDADRFTRGGMIPVGECPVIPGGGQDRWDESLLIRHLDVVQDPERTNDACLAGGNPDGVWTFKHLMSEMATGSGMTTHDFVVAWLQSWLNPYTVNGDTVPARPAMFNQVILPWANASGITASLQSVGGVNTLTLGGELNLDVAPFRLSAIVNRIDLGATEDGSAGYGGSTTVAPINAGELRFVFGVQNLGNCTVLPFSVILEYGVPIEGCAEVRAWANEWVQLNDAGFAAPFSSPWREHLESLTQSVVVHGAAPEKGNQNAINQIRTNENALNPLWELREFTLTEEDPIHDTDIPIDGPLQPHTVAMTPDDTPFSPTPHPVVNAFVHTEVLSGVPPSLSAPGLCSASYSVPGQFSGQFFRGGNSFMDPLTHWRASVNGGDLRHVCGRHQFSLNTCNGCHSGETLTPFFHVDPQASPAGLSQFLTGNGSLFAVDDVQFSSPQWLFADLRHRLLRLYKIACAPCGARPGTVGDFLRVIVELNGAVPVDPIDPRIQLPFKSGPVLDLEVVQRLIEARPGFIERKRQVSVELGTFARPAEPRVH